MNNIWHNEETPGYEKGKAHTSFSKWRVLVVDRTSELTGAGDDDSVARLHRYGKAQLGIAYEDNMTAEELAQILAR